MLSVWIIPEGPITIKEVPVSRGKRRTIFWILFLTVGAWVGAAIYLGEIMLRLPHKTLSRVSQWDVAPPENVEITAADGLTMRGWFFRPPQPNGSTVILLHGQTDNRAGMLGYANLSLRHGYNALVPDLRAHGASDGKLATYGFLEAGDVHRWVDWVMDKQPGGRIFGFGESMGGAILLQALAIESRFCAVVAEAPYATLREIAYDRLSQRYGKSTWPGRYVLRPILELSLIYERIRYGVDLGRVSPEKAVAASQTPVLLIFGSQDDNTPVRHARSIHQANPSKVTLWEIPGAGHTGAWGSRPKEFERRVPEWFGSARCL
jgi:pimeloyl-ACP methyl ester carboxylesterase